MWEDLLSRKVLWAVASLAALVLGLIVLQGVLAGTGNTFIPADFSVSGQFGDSFGAITSFLSGLAAVGAWSAVVLQRRELHLAEEQRIEDDEERQKRDFDNHFYQLLANFESILQGIDHRLHMMEGVEVKRGKDAVRLFADQVLNRLRARDPAQWEEVYCNWFSDNQDDFAHYFRFLYHLVVYVDRSAPNAVVPMAFLCAKLSEPELILLGFNCAFGEGRGNFKNLVEKYHLLHNLSEQSKNLLRVSDEIKERAFAPGMSGKFLGAKMERKIINSLGEAVLYKFNEDDPAEPYRDSGWDRAYIAAAVVSGSLTIEEARQLIASSRP